MSKKTAPPARRETPTAPAAPSRSGHDPEREVKARPEHSGPVKVRATQLGYYDEIRRREGDVFIIRSLKDFSAKWMQRVNPGTPERITTGVEELRKKHDELLRERMPGGNAPMLTDDEPGDNPLDA